MSTESEKKDETKVAETGKPTKEDPTTDSNELTQRLQKLALERQKVS